VIGLEARLVGLLEQADRLVQGSIALVEFLGLAGELPDTLQEQPVVPVVAVVGAVGHFRYLSKNVSHRQSVQKSRVR
jgi:hypothetical protein